MTSTLARVSFAFHDNETMILNPFTRTLSRMMTIPRAAVRSHLRAFIPPNGLLVNRYVIRVKASNFFMALRCHTRMLKSTNASFCFRGAGAYVRRLIRRISDFWIFKKRSMLIIRLRFRVHLLITRHVAATTCLRTNATINKIIRFVR